MPKSPSERTVRKYHRWFAVEANNSAWALAAQAERTPEQDEQMLYRAYAAAFHWSQVGTPLHAARAWIALAHVHSWLGQGELAQEYANRALAFFQSNECADWDLAFAHAELAFAAAVTGNPAQHARYYLLAQEAGNSIQDPEDRQVFFDEFARLPPP
jgi:hypothetical protein